MSERMAAIMDAAGGTVKRASHLRRRWPFVTCEPGETLGRFRGPAGGDTSRRRRFGRLGPRDRPVLHREAALEGAVDLLFDRRVVLTRDFRDFGDHEELGAVEHPLLPEREV